MPNAHEFGPEGDVEAEFGNLFLLRGVRVEDGADLGYGAIKEQHPEAGAGDGVRTVAADDGDPPGASSGPSRPPPDRSRTPWCGPCSSASPPALRRGRVGRARQRARYQAGDALAALVVSAISLIPILDSLVLAGLVPLGTGAASLPSCRPFGSPRPAYAS